MNTSRTWSSILAWDGILPLMVCVLPLVVRILLPGLVFAELLVVIPIPILAALFRCEVGCKQIREICDGKIPLKRQFALAAAIVLLFLFEGLVSVLALAKDAPHSMWSVALIFYAGYLTMVTLAFVAPRKSDNEDFYQSVRS